ncbi:hypothetical protein [Streptomyces syringium]|uniref:hypothetical protein n=1 Tax=Streptomyces syringium TaxID=76729 RepID=UPI0034114FFA
MTTTAISALKPAGTPLRTERPVPRWANLTAHAIPLLLLPQCLWRLPFAFHFEMGLNVEGEMPSSPWVSIPYVFGLSVLTEGLALLCFGLVRGWGEVGPSWLPVIGGKHLAPRVVITIATVGGLCATVFWAPTLLSWFGAFGLEPAGYANEWWGMLAKVCITPGMLWGPLVLVLTYAYYVRRCRTDGS